MLERFQAYTIIVLYALLLCINVFGTGVKSMQSNWPIYRCNPIMMPFAGYFSPDGTTTAKNFSYCIQNIMFSFAPTVTQPFNYLQSMSIGMMNSINTSNENTTDQTSFLKSNVAGIIMNLYEVMINVIVEFNIIVIKMIDTQGKLAGVMSVMMHVITSVQYTFESMWNGVPGIMIKTIAGVS